jgi:hypothetical protein
MQYLAIGIRCLVGVVFLTSSLSKAAGGAAFNGFVESIRETRLLPAALARPMAIVVVLAEFAAWILVSAVVFPAVAAGFAVAAGLLVAFTVGIVLVVRRGGRVSCRCFGASTIPLGPRHVVRNVFLIGTVGVGAAGASTSAGPLHPAGVAAAVCAGLVLGALVTRFDDIVDLFRPVNTHFVE